MWPQMIHHEATEQQHHFSSGEIYASEDRMGVEQKVVQATVENLELQVVLHILSSFEIMIKDY